MFLSQNALAMILKVSVVSVNRWETGILNQRLGANNHP